jgi:hypothetical protein
MYSRYPSGMEEYLSVYGWHFSKNMCDWAVSRMEMKSNPMNKEQTDELLKKYNISLDRKYAYDYVFAINMALADYMGSSIEDEKHLALFVKDYVDDVDGYKELPFTRFYADCIGLGVPIIWEDMI